MVEIQRIPAAVEFDHRGENGAGRVRERLQLRQDLVRRGRLARLVRHGVEPLPGEPGDAPVLALRPIREPGEAFRRTHELGRGHARFRVLGDQREIDQRALLAQCGDGDPAAVRVLRAARDFAPDRIVALVGLQMRPRRLAILRFGKQRAQHHGEDGPDAGIRLRLQRRGKCIELLATARCGRPDLRSGIGQEKAGKLAGVRREFRDTEHPLRRVRVLVQR